MNWIQRGCWLLAIAVVMVSLGCQESLRETISSGNMTWTYSSGNGEEAIVGNGPLVMETRVANGGFTAIRTNGAMTLRIVGAGSPALTVSAQKNILPYLTTTVEGHELRIRMTRTVSYDQPITVTVTGAAIRALDLSGAVTAQADGLEGDQVVLKADGASHGVVQGTARVLQVTTTGVSSIDARRLPANRIDGHAEGASRITLAGSCQEAELEAVGASSIQAGGLETKRARLSAMGASTIHLGHGGTVERTSLGASTIRLGRE